MLLYELSSSSALHLTTSPAIRSDSALGWATFLEHFLKFFSPVSLAQR